MAGRGGVKNVFPGGNTYKGFHSFYDYIISDEGANRIFCIKGGPGVGKSSFMKSIASRFIEMGCDVELHHCSSDNNSLDGVVIRQAKVAILDGTAPHVVDPKNPGAVDEVLNFGDYWKLEGLVSERDTIINLNKNIKSLFNSSYRYLKCANEIQDDMDMLAFQATDKTRYRDMVLSIRADTVENAKATVNAGRDRHLFHSALTPDGRVDYIDTIITDGFKCYLIEGINQKGASDILNMLAHDYLLKGYDTEIYHQPLNPEKIETVVIDSQGMAFTSDVSIKEGADKVFNLNELIISGNLPEYLIKKDTEMIKALFDEAFGRIKEAKEKHDEMEKCYIPSMNFAAVSELEMRVVNRIMNYL